VDLSSDRLLMMMMMRRFGDFDPYLATEAVQEMLHLVLKAVQAVCVISCA
jgi:hypothetical protein